MKSYPASFYVKAFAKHCRELNLPIGVTRDLDFYHAMQIWLLSQGCEYYPGDKNQFRWDNKGEQLAFVLRWA